jgi:hypothetical protein
VQGQGTVTLNPGSTSQVALVGRLIPQTSADGLSTMSTIFNNVVHGKDSDVSVKGVSAGSSDVSKDLIVWDIY